MLGFTRYHVLTSASVTSDIKKSEEVIKRVAGRFIKQQKRNMQAGERAGTNMVTRISSVRSVSVAINNPFDVY